jgi:hypothetical protein
VEAPPESESPGTLNRQAGWFQLRVGPTEIYSPLIGSESIGRALPVALWAASPTVTGHCHVGAALTAQPSQYLM